MHLVNFAGLATTKSRPVFPDYLPGSGSLKTSSVILTLKHKRKKKSRIYLAQFNCWDSLNDSKLSLTGINYGKKIETPSQR